MFKIASGLMQAGAIQCYFFALCHQKLVKVMGLNGYLAPQESEPAQEVYLLKIPPMKIFYAVPENLAKNSLCFFSSSLVAFMIGVDFAFVLILPLPPLEVI